MRRLGPALASFRERLRTFSPSPNHFVSDLALRGLLSELEENAGVASAVLAGLLPHRAYPLARAAFEASQLSLLLATSDDYDLEGAKAWVFYLQKDADLARGHSPQELLDGLTPDEWLKAATNEIADRWEELSTGKAAVVSKAIEFLRTKPRKPDNFAGVSVGKELGKRLEARAKSRGAEVPDVGAAHGRAYSALSRGTHPRPSLRPLKVTLNGDRFAIELEPRDTAADRDALDALIAGAVNTGTAAINLRLAMGA